MNKCFDENVEMKEITKKYNSSLLNNKYPIHHQFLLNKFYNFVTVKKITNGKILAPNNVD